MKRLLTGSFDLLQKTISATEDDNAPKAFYLLIHTIETMKEKQDVTKGRGLVYRQTENLFC